MIQNIRGLHLAHSLLLALNFREYQIVYASLHIVIHVDAWETYLCKGKLLWMKCPHTSHVEGDRFLSMFRHGCYSHSFWNFQTLSNVHFPWPNDELSNCPYNGPQPPIPAILSIHLLHEFILNVKCRMDGFYRKP